MSGEVIEHNNWWGDVNPDFDKLIIYEKENKTPPLIALLS